MYTYWKEANKIIQEFKKTIKPNSWKRTYYRIEKFFNEFMDLPEHRDRKLMEITEKEIDDFLGSLPYKQNEKANYYRVLKKFFDFSYKLNYTRASFLNVKKVEQVKVPLTYISEEDFQNIKTYINGDDRIENRLLLALFLYTGLSRKYIHKMSFSQFSDDCTQYHIGNEDIPLKPELIRLLRIYKEEPIGREQHFFDIQEDTVSSNVRRLSEKACGKGYTPTEFSNTFIKKSLGEDKDKNIYAVSKLTHESLGTIEKHIKDLPNWLIDRQNVILKQW